MIPQFVRKPVDWGLKVLPFALLVGYLLLGIQVQSWLGTWIPGSVIGMILRWFRITDPVAVGVAMGVAGHGIATASLVHLPLARMAASLGMVSNGAATSVVLPIIVP